MFFGHRYFFVATIGIRTHLFWPPKFGHHIFLATTIQTPIVFLATTIGMPIFPLSCLFMYNFIEKNFWHGVEDEEQTNGPTSYLTYHRFSRKLCNVLSDSVSVYDPAGTLALVSVRIHSNISFIILDIPEITLHEL